MKKSCGGKKTHIFLTTAMLQELTTKKTIGLFDHGVFVGKSRKESEGGRNFNPG